MRSGIAILCALLAVYVLAWEASAERAKRKGAVTLYRATIELRVLFGAGTLSNGVLCRGSGSIRQFQTRLVGIGFVVRLGGVLCVVVAS